MDDRATAWVVPCVALATASIAALGALWLAGALAPLPEAALHYGIANAVFLPSIAVVLVRIRKSAPRERLAWSSLALAMMGWYLADWIRDPTLHAFLRYVGYAGFAASLPVLALPARRNPDQRWLLDALIVTVVVSIVCIETLLRPLTEAVGETHTSAAVALSFPLLDVALAAALIMSIYAGGATSRRTMLLFFAVCARMLSDFAHLYATAFFDFDPQASSLDVGWLASYVFIAAAAAVSVADQPIDAALQSRAPTRWGFLVPYCAVVLLTTVTIAASLWGPPPPALVIGAGIAIALAAVRQAATSFEHLRIHRELQRALAAEREAARIDPLTGVLNHGAITSVIADAISAQAGRTTQAIVMVDVDELKATNDTFGHQAGDRLLVATANALCQAGAVVGRYAGDEFAVLLPGAGRAQAEAYVRSVTITLEQTDLHHDGTSARIPARASLGIAIFPNEAETVPDLMRLADGAMYAAKRAHTSAEPLAPSPHRRRDDGAVRLVAELIPLLASPGDVRSKLTLIGNRLASACGYDGVRIAIFGPPLLTSLVASDPNAAAAGLPQDDPLLTEQPLRALLEATHGPVIVDDMSADARFSPGIRATLSRGELHAALVVPMLWHDDVIGSIGAARKVRASFTPADAQLLATVAGQITAIVMMASLVDSLQQTSERVLEAQAETVLMLAAVAEAHDRTTGLHLVSIRRLTEALAVQLGYDDHRVHELGLAAVLHDIGKVSVPRHLLSTAGRLAREDWEVMKQHTVWGEEFLAGRAGFSLAAMVARTHHERWDGAGYPDGLAADQIPEEAAIVTVADSFDAMTDDRPYRVGLSVHQALAEIVANRGTQFSPRVVDALLRLADVGVLDAQPQEIVSSRAA